MMPSSIHMATFLGAIAIFAIGALLGFVLRSRQLKKFQHRILELESDMVANHAEILRLHKLQSDSSETALDGATVISLVNGAPANVRKHL